MIERFFTGKKDTNLDKQGKIQSGDMMISKREFYGKAVWDDTTQTFTLSTSAVIADDAFNDGANPSAFANLLVVDDDGKVARVAVNDTVGTTKAVTVVEANIKRFADDTAAVLTDGETYDVAIYTPTKSSYDYAGKYGSFAGYVELSFNVAPEFAKQEYGVPSKPVWKDRTGTAVTLTGNTKMVSNADSIEAFLGGVLYGSQVGQNAYGIASNQGEMPHYLIAVVGKDKSGQLGIDWWWDVQFAQNGEVSYSGKEYKSYPFTGEVLAHAFFPEDEADFGMMIRNITA